jgi:hypothetical protein
MVASAKPIRTLRNYINGEFVEGGNGFIQSINPATGEHIADIPKSGKTEVDAGECTSQRDTICPVYNRGNGRHVEWQVAAVADAKELSDSNASSPLPCPFSASGRCC